MFMQSNVTVMWMWISIFKTYSAALHSPIQGVINRKFSYLFKLC